MSAKCFCNGDSLIRGLLSGLSIVLGIAATSAPSYAGDLAVRNLPRLGDPADAVRSRLAFAAIPASTGQENQYFLSIAGTRTLLHTHYYTDGSGKARLAAVEIGYRSKEIPMAAYRAFLHVYLPDDAVVVHRANYTAQELIETDTSAGEVDAVFASASHAAALKARSCRSGVRASGLIVAVQSQDHVVNRVRVESEYGTACWTIAIGRFSVSPLIGCAQHSPLGPWSRRRVSNVFTD